MSKIINKVLLISFCLYSGVVMAQATKLKVIKKEINLPLTTVDNEKKNSIAVYAGLPSFGIGYGRKLNDYFNARINYSILKLNHNINNIEFDRRKVNAGVGLDFHAVDLFVDYNPSIKSSFKFVIGASYISNMQISALIAAANGQEYGDIILSKEDIGEVFIDAKWSGIAPYIATGFGRVVPKRNIGFGFEVGGHFLGKPTFNYVATKMLIATNDAEKESKNFENFVNAITFLPTIKFHLAYKL